MPRGRAGVTRSTEPEGEEGGQGKSVISIHSCSTKDYGGQTAAIKEPPSFPPRNSEDMPRSRVCFTPPYECKGLPKCTNPGVLVCMFTHSFCNPILIVTSPDDPSTTKAQYRTGLLLCETTMIPLSRKPLFATQ